VRSSPHPHARGGAVASARPDDLAIFASELPGLRQQWPAAAIIRSAIFEAFASDARSWFAAMQARAATKQQAALDHNAWARARCLEALPCPDCATPGPHRFVDPGDTRRAYFICVGCGRSFGMEVSPAATP
jgi:hypothetical protein